MSLRDLISSDRKANTGQSATATLATPATLPPDKVPSVATVATVSVASGQILARDADPWAEYIPALRSGVLIQCRACTNFGRTIPHGGDTFGVFSAGWCRRFDRAMEPDLPWFACDGYTRRTSHA